MTQTLEADMHHGSAGYGALAQDPRAIRSHTSGQMHPGEREHVGDPEPVHDRSNSRILAGARILAPIIVRRCMALAIESRFR